MYQPVFKITSSTKFILLRIYVIFNKIFTLLIVYLLTTLRCTFIGEHVVPNQLRANCCYVSGTCPAYFWKNLFAMRRLPSSSFWPLFWLKIAMLLTVLYILFPKFISDNSSRSSFYMCRLQFNLMYSFLFF